MSTFTDEDTYFGAEGYDGGPDELACPEPGCSFTTTSSSGLKRHQTRSHGATPAGHRGGAPADGASTPETGEGTTGGDPLEPEPPLVEERPPRPIPPAGRRTLLDRVRGRLRNGSQGKATAGPKPPRPKPGKRIPLANDFSSLYSGLGRRLEGTAHYPTGRILTYQAPGAGVIFDRAIANTAADRFVFQPIVRSKEKWEDVAYLLAPPVLTFSVQTLRIQQAAAVEAGDMDEARRLDVRMKVAAEMLAWALRGAMLRLAPAMAEAQKRAEEEAEVIREAFPFLADTGMDPVEAVMSSLFAPPQYGGPEDVSPANGSVPSADQSS